MSQSKPINTALLSYGMSGEIFHAPLLAAHSGFVLTHVLQRRTSTAARHYPEVDVVSNIDDIISNEAIELVVVNTPNESHYDFTVRMLEAGKHVIVEKPFTVTAEEADRLITLAKQRQRVLSVFQNRRWDGDFLTVQKVLHAQLIGTLVEFELHYDRFRNYIEANTWKEEAAPGTGILYNLGSHMLDQVIVLFGMPRELNARLGIQRPGGRVDDFYDIWLQYDGFHAIVKSSYLVRASMPRYIMHGTAGSFVKFGIDPQEQALKERAMPGAPGWGQEPESLWGRLNTSVDGLHVSGSVETLPGNYLAYYENVYHAIRNGAELAVKPEQARDVIRLIEACVESNRKRIAIPF